MQLTTEDGKPFKEGDRLFNYYDLRVGTVGEINPLDRGWFDFKHDNGTSAFLNGERVCSLEYAKVRGWLPDTLVI
jgi:hypothetical protein